MKIQEPRKPATTFIYPNKLELGEGVDHNGITVGEWNSGFFNCCDDIIPNGLMACICPVVSVAQIEARLGLGGNYWFILCLHVALYIAAGLTATVEDDPLLLLLCVVAEFISTASIACLRVKMRDLFSIPGNILQDATLVVLCRPCAVAQMATNIGAGKCMFTTRTTLPGYHNYGLAWHIFHSYANKYVMFREMRWKLSVLKAELGSNKS